jgi:hypothetical protein
MGFLLPVSFVFGYVADFNWYTPSTDEYNQDAMNAVRDIPTGKFM